MEIIKLEDPRAFDQATGNGVCMVDFNAPWCAPCRAQEPILHEIAEDFDASAAVAELDVTVNREVASRLRIHSIPTIIVFKDGKEMKRFVGLQPKDVLAGALKQALAQSTSAAS
ncbi:MAG: thioredoxin domain-containing protein [Desulfosalsimonadaceae bacterium]